MPPDTPESTPIDIKYNSLKELGISLGDPTSQEITIQNGRGKYRHYVNGSIYWTEQWGAFEVHGAIRQKWLDLGGEQGFLGFPVTDESSIPGKNDTYNVFEHGVITWSSGESEAVATPHDYNRLYSTVRSQILSRFFAIGMHGRRNYFTMFNNLKDPVPVNPSTPEEREQALWKIIQSNGENPMLVGSAIYIMLAIEHSLGNDESTKALKAGLQTLESLYWWSTKGKSSSKLPLRWDAGIPTDAKEESEKFLVGPDGLYTTGIPSTDIHHFPFRINDTLRNLGLEEHPPKEENKRSDEDDPQAYYVDHYRQWELSTDELTGLITTYWIINKLSTDEGITSQVKRQAEFLGNYLADNGYILVRPMGGLTWRGSSGILPALEFPFSRTLGSISGKNMSSRVDFKGAMERAGYWRNLVGPITNLQIAYVTLGPLLIAIVPFVASIITPIITPAIIPVAEVITIATTIIGKIATEQGLSPSTLAGAMAVAMHSDCLDINEPGELALALIAKDCNSKDKLYPMIADIQATYMKYDKFSVNFHSWIGLTGLDDSDDTIRNVFKNWYSVRQHNPKLEIKGSGSKTIFASAINALIDPDATHESELLSRIDQAIVELFRTSYFEPKLPLDETNTMEYCQFPHYLYRDKGGNEIYHPYSPLDLCVGIAMAFWHAQRQKDMGSPITMSRFPQPPNANNFVTWPKASVPVTCVNSLMECEIPPESIQGNLTPLAEGDVYPLFNEPLVSRRLAPTPPSLVPATNLIFDKTITISPKNLEDVSAGIALQKGDEVEIDASGSIWAGVRMDPTNGPNGHEGQDRMIDDARWPLHTGLDIKNAHAFCLLGRLNGYFFIGEQLKRTRYVYHTPRELFLRINDDGPGDGDGEFSVRVRVWGIPDEKREFFRLYQQEIRCVVFDQDNVISEVGIGDEILPISVQTIVDWINTKKHSFFTLKDNKRAKVVARKHHTGRWYLTTLSDDTRLNNLDFLPKC